MTEFKAVDDRFSVMRKLSRGGQSPSLEERLSMLTKLEVMAQKNKDIIAATIEEDFGSRGVCGSKLSDVFIPVNAIRYIKKNLKNWMKPVPADFEFPFGFFGKGYSIYEPKGVILIVSPWNYPVNLPLMGLADALAAGNRVIIKPSEFTPNTGELLKKMISETFDSNQVAVITGESSIGSHLCGLPFDHILFTGSPNIGKKVMEAAAANLTPVTLELGGKCPVIVAADHDIKKAAGDIINSKLGNAGQTCIAPDYVFVPRGTSSAFTEACANLVRQHWGGLNAKQDYCSVINERNYDRINAMVTDAEKKGAKIIDLDADPDKFDKAISLRFPPKILLDTTETMIVRQDEIFGPLLPVIEYDSIDETISYINNHEKPLALYVYTHKDAVKKQVIDSTSSGGVCVNGLMYHCLMNSLPFGGIGNSGMGAYHGVDGFHAFSHKKAVFLKNKRNSGKPGPPPPGSNVKFDGMIDSDYAAMFAMAKTAGIVGGILGFGIVSVILGRRRGWRIPKIKITW